MVLHGEGTKGVSGVSFIRVLIKVHGNFTNMTYMHAYVLSHLSHVRLCATLRTTACQAPLYMGVSRQEYWSGLPCPPPGVLSNPGIEPVSLMSPALAGGFFTTSATWEAPAWLQAEKI